MKNRERLHSWIKLADNAESTLSYLPVRVSRIARFIPLRAKKRTGMLATVGALSIAFKRMQQRDAVGYQRWLRARVLAQGLTIVAIVVAGVQEMGVGVLTGNSRPVARPPTSAWESAEFEKRLKGAEEAHRLESGETVTTSASAPVPPSPANSASQITPSQSSSSSSILSWLGLSKK